MSSIEGGNEARNKSGGSWLARLDSVYKHVYATTLVRSMEPKHVFGARMTSARIAIEASRLPKESYELYSCRTKPGKFR